MAIANWRIHRHHLDSCRLNVGAVMIDLFSFRTLQKDYCELHSINRKAPLHYNRGTNCKCKRFTTDASSEAVVELPSNCLRFVVALRDWRIVPSQFPLDRITHSCWMIHVLYQDRSKLWVRVHDFQFHSYEPHTRPFDQAGRQSSWLAG